MHGTFLSHFSFEVQPFSSAGAAATNARLQTLKPPSMLDFVGSEIILNIGTSCCMLLRKIVVDTTDGDKLKISLAPPTVGNCAISTASQL